MQKAVDRVARSSSSARWAKRVLASGGVDDDDDPAEILQCDYLVLCI